MIGKLDERCSAAFGDIDAFLLERHALISNLTETVKGFAIQESKVFKDVLEARAMAMTSTGQVKLEAENQIGQSLTNLFQLTESYPELESSSHFRELRQEMVRIEGRITAARRFYNLSVEEYNSLCRAFPANIWSKLATTRTYEKFSLGESRAQLSDPVQISFSPSHQAG
jgi:LemA protein